MTTAQIAARQQRRSPIYIWIALLHFCLQEGRIPFCRSPIYIWIALLPTFSVSAMLIMLSQSYLHLDRTSTHFITPFPGPPFSRSPIYIWIALLHQVKKYGPNFFSSQSYLHLDRTSTSSSTSSSTKTLGRSPIYIWIALLLSRSTTMSKRITGRSPIYIWIALLLERSHLCANTYVAVLSTSGLHFYPICISKKSEKRRRSPIYIWIALLPTHTSSTFRGRGRSPIYIWIALLLSNGFSTYDVHQSQSYLHLDCTSTRLEPKRSTTLSRVAVLSTSGFALLPRWLLRTVLR